MVQRQRVSPAQRLAVFEGWLQGNSLHRLAKEHRIGLTTAHAIVKEARQDLQVQAQRTAEEVLAEVALLRAEAWRKYRESTEPITKESVERVFAAVDGPLTDAEALAVGKSANKGKKPKISGAIEHKVRRLTEKRTGEPSWLQIVQWCLDFEAKIRGLTAPSQVNLEFRVAGVAPEALDGEMLARLADALQRRGAKPLEGTVIESRVIEGAEGGEDGDDGGDSDEER